MLLHVSIHINLQQNAACAKERLPVSDELDTERLPDVVAVAADAIPVPEPLVLEPLLLLLIS